MKLPHSAAVIALLLAAVACQSAFTAPPAAESLPLTAISADELRDLLKRHDGEVVLLNFWATWCRPCLKEIPALRTLADRYAASGFVLVPVSLDEPETAPAVVPPFLTRWFPGFRSWLSAEPEMDTIVSVVDPAWNEVLPTSYIIGRSGEAMLRLQGGKSIEEFDAAINAALQP